MLMEGIFYLNNIPYTKGLVYFLNSWLNRLKRNSNLNAEKNENSRFLKNKINTAII